jgi:hypothetical protein
VAEAASRLEPCETRGAGQLLILFELFVLFDRSSTLRLLYLVFAFGAGGRVFDSLLSFGFFHGSLGFSGAFGAGFATLLALLIEDFFAAQEFDEGVVSAVTLAPSRPDDAQVTAVAIAEAGADGVEEFVDGGAGHQVREGLAAGGEISALAESNHFLDLWAHGFGFGDGGLHSLFEDKRSDQVPQQGAAVRGVTSQFPSCYFVAHG